jgi:hypothetical protein
MIKEGEDSECLLALKGMTPPQALSQVKAIENDLQKISTHKYMA